MGGAVSAGEDNDELIDNLVEAEYIKSECVERIFRAVDRGDYYLEGCKENAYRDLAWKHGHIHLSAPCIYSEVMESLQLAPGMSFLNLGSGTGYLSTMAGLILGTYGTNHGVELHKEVVLYARSKLEDFLITSPAIDKYEFCPPSFVVGNCLLLDSSGQQYDRVYCGASCPTEHENYMKNLVRVGGILVMPLNEHLLQVTRTGETSFEARSVLPVSFAPLVLPAAADAPVSVKLPEKLPLTLQEICRSTLRVLLRKNIEKENPSILEKKSLNKSKRRRPARNMKRIVIPLMQGDFEDDYRNDGNHEESESEEHSEGEDVGDLSVRPNILADEPGFTTHLSSSNSKIFLDFSFNPRRIATGKSNLAIQMHRSPEERQSVSTEEQQSDMAVEEDTEQAAEGSSEHLDITDEPRGRSPRKEMEYKMFERNLWDPLAHPTLVEYQRGISSEDSRRDSGISDENEVRDVRTMSEPWEYEVESGSGTKPPKKQRNGDSGIENISDEFEDGQSDDPVSSFEDGHRTMSYHRKRSAEDGQSDDPVSSFEDGHQTTTSYHLKRSAEDESEKNQNGRGCSAVVFKRVAFSDADSDDDLEDVDSDSGTEFFPKNKKEDCDNDEKKEKKCSDLLTYATLMRLKIDELPLPQVLKCFLNFDRPM